MKKNNSINLTVLICTIILNFTISTNSLSQIATQTGNLKARRTACQLQPLPNGKAIIFGGLTMDQSGNITRYKTSEIYDQSTGMWSTGASMTKPRINFASVVLSNGKILAIGGATDSFNSVTSVEEYDPTANKWTYKGALKSPRTKHTAILMNNGIILVMGGADSTFESSADGGTNWILHKFPTQKYRFPLGPSLINLNDGRVLCVGNYISTPPKSAYLISPSLTVELAKNEPKHHHYNDGLGKLKNGKILMLSSIYYESEIFDPINNTFSTTGICDSKHPASPLIPLTNGNFAVFGAGFDNGDKYLEVYNATTGKWSYPSGNKFSDGIHSYKAAPLQNNKWLISGGIGYWDEVYEGSVLSFIIDAAGQGSGIDETILPQTKMFYNSSLNNYNIELDANSFPDKNKMYLYNLTGNLVKLYNIDTYKASLFLPELSSGIYLIRLINEQTQKSLTSKFIVK